MKWTSLVLVLVAFGIDLRGNESGYARIANELISKTEYLLLSHIRGESETVDSLFLGGAATIPQLDLTESDRNNMLSEFLECSNFEMSLEFHEGGDLVVVNWLSFLDLIGDYRFKVRIEWRESDGEYKIQSLMMWNFSNFEKDLLSR